MNRIVLATLCIGVVGVAQPVWHASAQAPGSTPPNTFRRPTTSTAPKAPTEVRSDRTVTFRLLAPDAMHFDLQLEPGSRQRVHRDSSGVVTYVGGFTPDGRA